MAEKLYIGVSQITVAINKTYASGAYKQIVSKDNVRTALQSGKLNCVRIKTKRGRVYAMSQAKIDELMNRNVYISGPQNLSSAFGVEKKLFETFRHRLTKPSR